MVTLPAANAIRLSEGGEVVEEGPTSLISCKKEADCANAGSILVCIDGHIHCRNQICQCVND
ncbi:unnamed protein product [Linum tenue]|uniref:Uncharacterized protein n=1 Tax=Linum tenue TaxID=586396 RepID=A0AAV0KQV0_9ROSI|nr:unnamed protein product [Linum tenue]